LRGVMVQLFYPYDAEQFSQPIAIFVDGGSGFDGASADGSCGSKQDGR